MPAARASLLVALVLTGAGAPRPKYSAEVQNLLGLAYASPPEIAAHALLRIADSERVRERELKADLIEQAFRLASQARERAPRRHVPGHAVDTRSGYQERALRLELDALTLQSRAVRALLPLDAPKARRLFEEMPPPAPPSLACEDPLVWDVSDYYQALAAVANRAVKNEDRAGFVSGRLAPITSPSQVVPALRLLPAVSLEDDERAAAAAALAGALDSIASDDRSFTFWLSDLRGERPDSDALREALARYISTRSAGRRCAAGGEELKLHAYWQSPAAQEMFRLGMKLRWGGDGAPGRPLSEAERGAPEWRHRYLEALNAVAEWRSSDEETEADYFHQKCVVYRVLIELAPPGAERDRAASGYLEFLAASPLQRERPAEWLFHTVELVDRAAGRAQFLAALTRTGHPALMLWAALAR